MCIQCVCVCVCEVSEVLSSLSFRTLAVAGLVALPINSCLQKDSKFLMAQMILLDC